jgi:hypothetical protein
VTLLAGALLAAALAGAAPDAPVDAVADAERELAALEARLADVDRGLPQGADRVDAADGRRSLARGEARHALGDDAGALAPLFGALERGDLSGPDAARAQALLGASLASVGRCNAALEPLARAAAGGGPEARDAATQRLACLERLGRDREVPEALARARALGAPPPEALYLAAKSAWRRSDLPAARRDAAALAALDEVPPPFALAAGYLRGALHLRAGAPDRAVPEFERCASAAPATDRETAVRDLCLLALGRVHGDAGRADAALAAYARVPRGSPRLAEAMHESAWVNLRARRLAPALRAAGLVAEAAPESSLAPRATLLAAQLLLRLDRTAEAVDAYGRVVRAWEPLRDELDALLASPGDAAAWLDGEGGAPGAGQERGGVPPVALRWAVDDPRVARARDLVAAVDEARRDLAAASASADRLQAAVQRAWGLGAAPALEAAFEAAESVEDAAAGVAGRLAEEEARLLGPAFSAREDWLRASDARHDAGAALVKLPRTPDEVSKRAALRRSRMAAFDALAARLDGEARGCEGVAGSAAHWLARHGEGAAPRDREDASAELRAHALMAAAERRELAALRLELVRAGDAAGRGEDGPAADEVRRAFRGALGAEEELLAAARPGLAPAALPRAHALDALRARAGALQVAADAAKRRALAGARARSAAALAELGRVRARLDEDAAALAKLEVSVRAEAGALALAAFREVRGRLSAVLREADAGIADAAWARKRDAAERIQALSAEKARELARVEVELGAVARDLE